MYEYLHTWIINIQPRIKKVFEFVVGDFLSILFFKVKADNKKDLKYTKMDVPFIYDNWLIFLLDQNSFRFILNILRYKFYIYINIKFLNLCFDIFYKHIYILASIAE